MARRDRRGGPAAVQNLIDLAGTNGRHLIAAVGPCISAPAFEVGAEVVAEFVRVFGSDASMVHGSNADASKGHVDLRAAVRRQLLGAGVPSEQIDLSDRCSVRDADEFFSHRRDHGVTGRMAALIAPRNSTAGDC